MPAGLAKPVEVYQIKVTLRGSHPPIWRRIQVRSDITLAKLHRILQRVMGWQDSHLHQFVIQDERYGVPDYIRSDNGSEFTALLVREWLDRTGVKTLYIEPGSPWENGYCESFNGKLQDECLKREIFYTLTEAKVLIERWRRE